MDELSQGQKLALLQLVEIAARSGGALQLRGDHEPSGSAGFIWVRLSLETKGYRKEGGFEFRDRERLSLHIHPDFPFKKPDIYFGHKRFIGKPHVQWGTYICLYQSGETEYDPSDGLFGFFERVDMWMSAAGRGELDPIDAPLHPPVAYTSSSTKIVIKADTPAGEQWGSYWLGRAELKKVRDDRYDVVGWTNIDDWGELEIGAPIAIALLFNQPLAMEYPSQVDDLLKIFESVGLEFGPFYRLLGLLALLTPEGEPGRMVLGAPMRRKAAGEPLRPHLTVWEIGAEPLDALRTFKLSRGEDAVARGELAKWLVTATVKWCDVMEDRPEIVHRRDGGALLSTLTEKRVLLLGCGALGSAIAEMIVRAGASALHLIDFGIVKPGILVRQRYADDDIGLAKASVLKRRLERLGLSCAVSMEIGDVSNKALARFEPAQFDLVIDATASVSVTRRIEEELKERELQAPLISLAISAAANHGSLTARMPGFVGGPHRVMRQAKLELFSGTTQHPLVKAFWPERGEVKVFQPEPGCSSPTFIGSAADIDNHAAALLNLGIKRTQTLKPTEASIDLVAAPWLSDDQDKTHLHRVFEGYAVRPEQRHDYTVLQSETATRGMNAEMRRIARTRSDKIETGGLIFGEIDDSHRYIWIDSVSGPPPDSQASAEQFLCGVEGTNELAAFKGKASGGSSRFIGIWHTHPISRGSPSQDDLRAMVALLYGQNFPPRQVVMLIVGFAASIRELNFYLYRRDEFYLIAAPEAPEESGE